MNKLLLGVILLFSPLITKPQHSQKQVYTKMVDAGIKHPTIVLKQAIIESNHFRYKRAIAQNNYLGLLNDNGRLKYFDSLESCIQWYKNNVQNRYLGGDYFRFLKNIGYASDPRYKQKVKNVKLDFIIE